MVRVPHVERQNAGRDGSLKVSREGNRLTVLLVGAKAVFWLESSVFVLRDPPAADEFAMRHDAS